MIYFFYGDDVSARQAALRNTLKTLTKDTEIFQVDKNTFDSMNLESFYSGSGLFFKKCAVVLFGVLENEKASNFVIEKLSLMAESANEFLFLEDAPDKYEIQAFEEAGARVQEFKKPKEKKERFNSFILANFLGVRDRFHLWTGFRQAIREGVALDELTGVLFWKAKDMLLRKNFSNFSESELQAIAGRLASLLPEARRRGEDDELALERFILEAF